MYFRLELLISVHFGNGIISDNAEFIWRLDVASATDEYVLYAGTDAIEAAFCGCCGEVTSAQ